MGDGRASGRGDDRPRLLAARSEFGYVDRRAAALHGEPEAVPAETQEKLSAEARRREQRRRADAWRSARSLLSAGLVAFAPVADARTKSDLRAISRTLARIDQRLGTQ